MRLLGFDAESTGLDTSTDRITEIGLCLWEVETKRPLVALGFFLQDEELLKKARIPETAQMMDRVCGITPDLLEEFGTTAKENFVWLDRFVQKHKPDYLVAHNAEGFDKPLLYSELKRHGLSESALYKIPFIDTRTDIPFASEPDSRKLKHLAADHGFVSPWAHRALFDVMTMLRILSNYDIKDVLEYQKIPFVTTRAIVSYDQRQLAKDMRFSWEKIGDKTFPKAWVKRIKLNLLVQEQKQAQGKGFEIVVID